MKGAFRIGVLFGIPVKIHWTFGLLLLWVAGFAISSGLDWSATFLAVVIVMGLFLCVVMHEYGHALTARRFGVKTRDIILSPIGGLARLTHIPENPWKEIAIAIAGPLVNLSIAGILLMVDMLLEGRAVNVFSSSFWSWSTEQSLLILVAKVNLILMLFNLIPAFPMDGGRVFRAALALGLNRLNATAVASYMGQAFGAFLLVAFLYSLAFSSDVIVFGMNLSSAITALIGGFVIIAARAELRQTRAKEKLKGIKVREIMTSGITPVHPDTPISFLEPTYEGQKVDYLIGSGDEVTGVIFSEQLSELQSGRELSMHETAGSYASDLYEPLDSKLPASKAIEIFLLKGYRVVPVYTNGHLEGVLTRHNLNSVINRVYRVSPKAATTEPLTSP